MPLPAVTVTSHSPPPRSPPHLASSISPAVTMVEGYSSTPSLTNSEETISSGSELPLARPLLQLSPNDGAPSCAKGKQIATSRAPVHPPRTVSISTPYNRTPKSISHGPMHGFVASWADPTILHCLLSYIAWKEFHAVMRTCRKLRDLFRRSDVKNVVLSWFVPGYRFESRDQAEDEVPIDLTDLEALSELPPELLSTLRSHLRSAITIFTLASLSHACRVYCLCRKRHMSFGPGFHKSTCLFSSGSLAICFPPSLPSTSLAGQR